MLRFYDWIVTHMRIYSKTQIRRIVNKKFSIIVHNLNSFSRDGMKRERLGGRVLFIYFSRDVLFRKHLNTKTETKCK